MKKRHAFTLVEMLVVIAIIGIIAAMVVNMNAGAQFAKRKAQVAGDKATLTLMIDSYQSKLNFYPPDNTNVDYYPAGPVYDGWAATNPLLYELTGATNNYPSVGNIQLFDNTYVSITTIFQPTYGRSAVANANPDEPHDFFTSGPQAKEYTSYDAVTALKGLLVPVAFTNTLNPNGTVPGNFWHYDSSSTNRHNLQGYDLWAEYLSGKQNGGTNVIATNGNW